MTTGDRMRERRKESGIPVEVIADALGVSIATIYRYENGEIEKLPGSMLEPLANVLRTTPAYLMGWDDNNGNSPDIFNFPNILPIGEGSYVPLYGRIACGEPILAVEDLDDTVWMPDDVHADFALLCDGDSMINARIMDGDIVYLRSQPSVDNGEIAAVIVNDEEITLKRVYYNKSANELTLRAENPACATQYYSGEELDHIRIIGKAVSFLSGVK